MNAKELHSHYEGQSIATEPGKSLHATILRALSLLAAVEGSGEEIVRELLDAGVYTNSDGRRFPIIRDTALDEAAARIVSDAQEKERLRAENEELRNSGASAQEGDHRRIMRLQAELASVKAENERLRVDANKKQPYANGEVANQLKTWQQLAFELSQSIVALSVVKDGVTFFQKDPIKDQETFHLWLRLNDAQTAVLDAYRSAHPKDTQ